jgi:hypothetical protein
MDSPLHTLRLALLVTLFVVLIYILYKRLLKAMGKDKDKPVYASLNDVTYEGGINQLTITCANPSMETLTVNINDAASTLIHSEVFIGTSSEDLQMEVALEPGRYQVEVVTDNHRTSRYFTV